MEKNEYLTEKSKKFEKISRNEFTKEIFDNQHIFYRNNFDPLAMKNFQYFTLARKDNTNWPNSELHFYSNKMVPESNSLTYQNLWFVKQEICETWLDNPVEYRRLLNLHQDNFKYSKFEKIIGVSLIDNDFDYIYHTYSQGIELLNLPMDIPRHLKVELETVLANALRELHDNGIEYHAPIPSNFKYDLHKRIIFNPHNSIKLKKPKTGEHINRIRDLSIILYTQQWIKNHRKFIEIYGKGEIDPDRYLKFVKEEFYRINEGNMECLNKFWLR